MSEEGYLQLKTRELKDQITKLEEKEKLLSAKYERISLLLENEVSNALKDLEHIKKFEQDTKEFPKLLFDKLEETIHNLFVKEWEVASKHLGKEFSEAFKIQSKINANEFNVMANKYKKEVVSFESGIHAIIQILIDKNITTEKELRSWSIKHQRRIKPLYDDQLKTKIHSEPLTKQEVERRIGISFDNDIDDLIEENRKVLMENK